MTRTSVACRGRRGFGRAGTGARLPPRPPGETGAGASPPPRAVPRDAAGTHGVPPLARASSANCGSAASCLRNTLLPPAPAPAGTGRRQARRRVTSGAAPASLAYGRAGRSGSGRSCWNLGVLAGARVLPRLPRVTRGYRKHPGGGCLGGCDRAPPPTRCQSGAGQVVRKESRSAGALAEYAKSACFTPRRRPGPSSPAPRFRFGNGLPAAAR